MATFGAEEVLAYSAANELLQLALQYLQTGSKVQLFSSQTHWDYQSLKVARSVPARNLHRVSKVN